MPIRPPVLDVHRLGGLDLSLVLNVLPDAVVVIDGAGTVIDGNAAAERLVGRPRQELIGASALDLLHPDDAHFATLSLASVVGRQVGTPIELRVRSKGGWRLVELIGAAAGDGRIVLSIRDLTDRRRWEVAGDEVSRFRSLVQHAATVTMLLDPEGVVTSVSAAITRQLGLDQEHVCGQPLPALVHEDDRAAVLAGLDDAKSAACGAPPVTVEARFPHFSGAHVPFELTVVSLIDDPTVRGLVVTAHDITRLRQAQDALAALANIDELTGLPNRRAFDAALDREWKLTSRDGIDSYVVVADLDGFKALNDTFGHAAGDDALRRVAGALRMAVRETDTVARLGGDEFGIILVRAPGSATVLGFEDRFRERLAEAIGALPLEVGVTVGHASLRSAPSAASALHEADMAMLARKRDPRHVTR